MLRRLLARSHAASAPHAASAAPKQLLQRRLFVIGAPQRKDTDIGGWEAMQGGAGGGWEDADIGGWEAMQAVQELFGRIFGRIFGSLYGRRCLRI